MNELGTFPCAHCGLPTPEAKLAKGPDFVFCRASCERDFRKRGFADAERRRMLAEYHHAASRANPEARFDATGKTHNRRMKVHNPVGSELSPELGLQTVWRCDADQRRMYAIPPPNAPESWDHFFEVMRERGHRAALQIFDNSVDRRDVSESREEAKSAGIFFSKAKVAKAQA